MIIDLRVGDVLYLRVNDQLVRINCEDSESSPLLEINLPHSLLCTLACEREDLAVESSQITIPIYDEVSKDVHTEHCCAQYGCKYGEEDTCPVWLGYKKQSFGYWNGEVTYPIPKISEEEFERRRNNEV